MLSALQLKSLQEQLTEERTALTRDTEAEKAEVERRWQRLRDEIQRMEEVHNLQQVILRVVKKVTPRNTHCMRPGGGGWWGMGVVRYLRRTIVQSSGHIEL